MALPIFISELKLSKEKVDNTQKFVDCATSKFNPKEETYEHIRLWVSEF